MQKFEGLKRNLGIIVDVPRQGSGNSNDGNTARRFFRDPETISHNIKVDVKLIKRFNVVLQTLACDQNVNLDKFEIYLYKNSPFIELSEKS